MDCIDKRDNAWYLLMSGIDKVFKGYILIHTGSLWLILVDFGPFWFTLVYSGSFCSFTGKHYSSSSITGMNAG